MLGNWDKIVEMYEEVQPDSSIRYSEHIKGILELIPDIRKNPTFMDTIPGTSHTILFLEIPGIKSGVYIWCERINEVYRICIYDPVSNTESDVKLVDRGNVILLLERYVEKLRKMKLKQV
jgi:hypothetical protein